MARMREKLGRGLIAFCGRMLRRQWLKSNDDHDAKLLHKLLLILNRTVTESFYLHL